MRQERLERGDRDRLVSAFLLKHVKQHSGGRPALRMAIKVHYVIEVAWPRPLSERPQFFAERFFVRSEEHTSELQSRGHLVCRLLLEKKKTKQTFHINTTLITITK